MPVTGWPGWGEHFVTMSVLQTPSLRLDHSMLYRSDIDVLARDTLPFARLGCSRRYLMRDHWNKFDGAVAVVSIAGLFVKAPGLGLNVVNVFRIARVFRLIKRAKVRFGAVCLKVPKRLGKVCVCVRLCVCVCVMYAFAPV